MGKGRRRRSVQFGEGVGILFTTNPFPLGSGPSPGGRPAGEVPESSENFIFKTAYFNADSIRFLGKISLFLDSFDRLKFL